MGLAVVRGAKRQNRMLEVVRLVFAGVPHELAGVGCLPNERRSARRDNDQWLGSTRQQRAHLAGGDLATADDDDFPVEEVEEGGEIRNAAIGVVGAGHG